MYKFNENKKKAIFPHNSASKMKAKLPSLDKLSKNRKNFANYTSKKILNITDFIQQKNKFKMNSIFDEKGTKDFLSSKEKALMEIKLEEDIKNIKYHSNNNTLIKEKEKIIKFDENPKIRKEKTNSPRKKNRKSIENKKEKKEKKMRNEQKNNKNDWIMNGNDLQDDYYIYKYILENPDESDDKLMEKLTQEIQRVQTNKKKNDKEKHKIRKSLTNNQKNIIKKVILKESNIKINPFNFSEYSKKLMISENIEVSSINEKHSIIPENNQIKTLGTLQTSFNKSNNKKNIYNEQEIIEKINCK